MSTNSLMNVRSLGCVPNDSGSASENVTRINDYLDDLATPDLRHQVGLYFPPCDNWYIDDEIVVPQKTGIVVCGASGLSYQLGNNDYSTSGPGGPVSRITQLSGGNVFRLKGYGNWIHDLVIQGRDLPTNPSSGTGTKANGFLIEGQSSPPSGSHHINNVSFIDCANAFYFPADQSSEQHGDTMMYGRLFLQGCDSIIYCRNTQSIGHTFYGDCAFTGGSGSVSDITTNLLLQYQLQDDAASTTIVATYGTNGTLAGAGNTSASSAAGPNRGGITKAVDFDGTDDHVIGPTIAATDGAGALTITLWVNRDTAHDYANLVTKYGSSSHMLALRYGGLADVSNVNLQFLPDNGTGTAFAQTATGIMTTGEWQHVAIVFDGSQSNSNKVKFYIDGRSTFINVQGTLPSTILNASSAPWWIGWENAGGAIAFDGKVADVRIYNSALTADDVMAVYNKGYSSLFWFEKGGQLKVTNCYWNNFFSTLLRLGGSDPYYSPNTNRFDIHFRLDTAGFLGDNTIVDMQDADDYAYSVWLTGLLAAVAGTDYTEADLFKLAIGESNQGTDIHCKITNLPSTEASAYPW